MAEITLERCKQAASVCRKIVYLRKEIEHGYDTYHSPSFSSNYKRSTGQVSDPTVQAVHRIDKLHEQLCDCFDFMLSFETDLAEQVEEPLIRAIIRHHYSLGYSWEKTSKEMLGLSFSDAAKQRIYRYFANKEGGERND